MILVFGGTTEGRKAVEVLEEAGTPYYYSTKTGEQDITLHHGERIDGALHREAMLRFCSEHDIRLLVDAAHPFATQLHQTVVSVAEELRLPLIRYERIYPEHDPQLIYCKDFDEAVLLLEEHRVERLLALTGINTLSKLRAFWQQHDCWWRILDRDSSRQIALSEQFPEDRLVYYGHDDTAALLQQLHPDAILTKESGLSGGFTEKGGGSQTRRCQGLRHRASCLSSIIHSPFSILHYQRSSRPAPCCGKAVARLLPPA